MQPRQIVGVAIVLISLIHLYVISKCSAGNKGVDFGHRYIPWNYKDYHCPVQCLDNSFWIPVSLFVDSLSLPPQNIGMHSVQASGLVFGSVRSKLEKLKQRHPARVQHRAARNHPYYITAAVACSNILEILRLMQVRPTWSPSVDERIRQPWVCIGRVQQSYHGQQ